MECLTAMPGLRYVLFIRYCELVQNYLQLSCFRKNKDFINFSPLPAAISGNIDSKTGVWNIFFYLIKFTLPPRICVGASLEELHILNFFIETLSFNPLWLLLNFSNSPVNMFFLVNQFNLNCSSDPLVYFMLTTIHRVFERSKKYFQPTKREVKRRYFIRRNHTQRYS